MKSGPIRFFHRHLEAHITSIRHFRLADLSAIEQPGARRAISRTNDDLCTASTCPQMPVDISQQIIGPVACQRRYPRCARHKIIQDIALFIIIIQKIRLVQHLQQSLFLRLFIQSQIAKDVMHIACLFGDQRRG